MFQIIVRPLVQGHIEPLSALFSTLLTEGIQIKDDELIAYASQAEVNDDEIIWQIDSWQERYPFEKDITELSEVNWNEEWEKNFDPVIIEDLLTIKADFHQLEASTKYTINIQPRMSFGTGHHATTWMMVKALSMIDVKGKKLLDAGTGTGILAILASMWNAEEVVGFDNDIWSYENACDNVPKNPVHQPILFVHGTLSNITDTGFDIVLANINKNYLMKDAAQLASKVKKKGHLIISGFYDVDSKSLLDHFHSLNLVAQYLQIRDNWACIVFIRNHS